MPEDSDNHKLNLLGVYFDVFQPNLHSFIVSQKVIPSAMAELKPSVSFALGCHRIIFNNNTKMEKVINKLCPSRCPFHVKVL